MQVLDAPASEDQVISFLFFSSIQCLSESATEPNDAPINSMTFRKYLSLFANTYNRNSLRFPSKESQGLKSEIAFN